METEFETGSLCCFWVREDFRLRWKPVSAGQTVAGSVENPSSPETHKE